MDTPTLTRTVAMYFLARGWAVNKEIALPDVVTIQHPVYTDWKVRKPRRIDLLAARSPRKRGLGPLEFLAFELKTTRADFLNDIRHPEKQAPWRAAAHRHAYAVPAGLVDPSEVPAESGLLTVSETGRVEWARKAPYTDTKPDVPWWLLKTVLYRAGQAEARIAGWTGEARWSGTSNDPEEMRAQIERLTKELERAHGARYRADDAAQAWRERYAAVAKAGIPCAHCGQGVRPGRIGTRHAAEWSHVDKAHDAACLPIRQAVSDARREAEPRMYYSSAPDPIFPANPGEDTTPLKETA